jgi:DNA-binding transcriptional regulator YhcF (GntR family)
MDLHISRESEVALHEQVAAQLVFLIGTGQLKPGSRLPSVRALAQRLGIHRNTIGRAYHDLTLNRLAERRAGSRLTVRAPEPEAPPVAKDLDEIVNAAVAGARRRGYSLQQLHERLRDRLLAAPPDHLLVLSDDAGMRMLFVTELKQALGYPVAACTPGELLSNPERGVGALVVSPQGHIPRLRSVLAAGRPAVPITYSPADEPLRAIRGLQQPSLIALVSVSRYFLQMARGVLAPGVGRRHSMRGYLLAGDRPAVLGAADFLVCDSITYPVVRPRYRSATVFVYKLVSADCLAQISSAMGRGR